MLHVHTHSSGEAQRRGEKNWKRTLSENMATTINNCQSAEYRFKLQEVQIFAELCTYVEHTLSPSSRRFRKQFDLGLCNIDIDLQLFDLGVDTKSKEYSSKAGNTSSWMHVLVLSGICLSVPLLQDL